MDKELKKRNLAVIKDNLCKVAAIKAEKPTKIGKLAIYMLGGRPVTGAIMINRFKIFSYRDAIYDLRKKGFQIESQVVIEKGVEHTVWWMADFDKEWILSREEKPFFLHN